MNWFENSDFFILAQWVCILIPIIWIGLSLLGDGEYISNSGFFLLIVLCNAFIIYSVYEDVSFLYEMLFDKTKNTETGKEPSLLWLLNFSPIVGGARLVSIILIIMYFNHMSKTEGGLKWLSSILMVINIIIALPAVVLVLL